MKNIITIFTGGTIGSKKNASGEISPEKEMSYRLLEMYEEKKRQERMENPDVDEEICFFPEEPYYILSENLSGKELFLLAECVKKCLSAEEKINMFFFESAEERKKELSQCEQVAADGVIIMHGTDTLAYTAAFLGLLFEEVQVPVLLVSSVYPLEDERANGFRNFDAAVEFIRGGFGAGVFVSYANEGETVKIHRGTRLIRSLEYSADIFSAGNRFYGSFTEDGRFLKNPEFMEEPENFYETLAVRRTTDVKKFDNSENVENQSSDKKRKREFVFSENCPEILRLFSYPGMIYPEIREEVKVILMESYHSGTIGISEGLKAFMKEAEKRKIPVYLTGLNKEDADYETVREYETLRVVPLRNKTAVTQYMKFWLLFRLSL